LPVCETNCKAATFAPPAKGRQVRDDVSTEYSSVKYDKALPSKKNTEGR
jgi:hypothetical protein